MLKQLAKSLPGIVLKSRADNTVKKYMNGFQKWKKWCSDTGSTYFPAEDITVALYLIGMMQSSNSPLPVYDAFYSIKWVHDIRNVKNPCTSKITIAVKDAAGRILEYRKSKKEPVTPEHLIKLAEKYGHRNATLKDVRMLTMCLLSYAGFLRWSELASLRCCDIQFLGEYLNIFIQKSKTDQYRDGHWLVVAKTGNVTCPYEMLRRYFSLAKLNTATEVFVFRALSFFKKDNGYRLRKENKSLSYTRTREVVLDAFESIGMDKKRFGLHSLRAGGATEAANAGVKDRLFKKHGRWRSENAKDGYVKDNIKERLSVSLKLGI